MGSYQLSIFLRYQVIGFRSQVDKFKFLRSSLRYSVCDIEQQSCGYMLVEMVETDLGLM